MRGIGRGGGAGWVVGRQLRTLKTHRIRGVRKRGEGIVRTSETANTPRNAHLPVVRRVEPWGCCEIGEVCGFARLGTCGSDEAIGAGAAVGPAAATAAAAAAAAAQARPEGAEAEAIVVEAGGAYSEGPGAGNGRLCFAPVSAVGVGAMTERGAVGAATGRGLESTAGGTGAGSGPRAGGGARDSVGAVDDTSGGAGVQL